MTTVSLSNQYLELDTSEGVRFRIPLAGPLSRAIAWLIDATVISATVLLIASVFAIFSSISHDLGAALQLLAAFVVQISYSIGLEWKWRGQTVGKRLLGLRVIDENGLKLTFSQVAMRNLLRVADLLPAIYVVGGVSCLVTRHGQRLGDLAAGTVVALVPSSQMQAFHLPGDSYYNSIREHPRLVARLRQSLTPEQARVLLEAVQRRDSLSPQARIELFSELAQTLRKVVLFPEECLVGLSDERLVLGVVESLFNPA